MDSLSVLVVEDSPSFSRLLIRGLEKEGYHVDVAPTIESAQDFLNQREYTVWLIDKKLPDGDGVELAFVLRQRGLDAPCIAMCEPDFSENQSPELEEAVDEFLPKPFAFDDLVKRMEKLVRDSVTQKLGKKPKQAPPKLTPPTPTTPPLETANPQAPSRGTLDPPSNLFRVLSAEEGLAKLTEANRLQQVAESLTKRNSPLKELEVVAPTLPMPTEDDIMNVFGELLDRNLSCQNGVVLKPSRKSPVMVASFATLAEEQVLGVCFIDLDLAHSAAGALALLSEEEVNSQLENGDLPEHLFALLKDVFRVLAGVFHGPNVPEVHLHHLYRATGLLPHEDAEFIEKHSKRLDLKFDIDGYPGGHLSMLL